MQTNLFFVYGTLLSGFVNNAYEYIRRYFHVLGNATVNAQCTMRKVILW